MRAHPAARTHADSGASGGQGAFYGGRTDQELVNSARQGDLRAFDELARRHAEGAYRVAVTVLHDHHDTQDAVQDAFLSAWTGLGGFRGDCEFATWLHRIVIRLALNRVSRRPLTSSLDEAGCYAAGEAGPAEAAEADAAAHDVVSAVRQLPAAQRSAITLRLDGLSYTQIADRTQTSLPATRSHLFRARRALAIAISDWH